MKKMKCIDMAGACDLWIEGETPEKMGENCKQHAMEMIAAGDQAHIAAAEKMKSMSMEDFQAFWADFCRRFESAEAV